jgi:all-trans-retinol 13,14-reductase
MGGHNVDNVNIQAVTGRQNPQRVQIMIPAPSHPEAKVGRPYRTLDASGEFDVLVVGSGIGGLAAAALLAKHAGKRVLVLERHYTAGGYTHVFRRTGYEWDVGVHYIGDISSPRSTFGAVFNSITDGKISWEPMGDPYDRLVIGGKPFDFASGADRFRASLKSYFPAEARAIDRYVDLVRSAARSSEHYFMEKALPGPLAWIAGPFLRRSFLRYASRTTADVLGELTQNQQLIGVLTGQWGDYGLPPSQSSFGIHALVAQHYLGGAAYPVGGASRIAAAIVPVIERAGGKVLVNAEVSRILVEGNRAVGVEMSDGRSIRVKTVISDAGAANTFGRLLPEATAGRLGLMEKLRAIGPSLAHINLYVGLRHSDEELGLGRTNLWIYPSPDHDANVARYLSDPESPLPGAYISFPSAKDPTFGERFPGRATIQVIVLAKYDWFARWEEQRWKRRDEGYEAFKQRFTDRLLEVLYANVPQVRGKVDHAELSTPLSTRHFANYAHGELYGLAHSPARFRQRFLRPQTPIRNLFLTGQDVTVCGVAGALAGGVLCASAILGRNLLSTASKEAAVARR